MKQFSLIRISRLATGALLALASISSAAITGVNPTGVNVRTHGVTTVFLTFQNVAPQESSIRSFWCGEISVSANTVVDFDPCLSGTLFGNLPVALDLSRRSGANNLTDIMTIPAAVSRRAYQDAAAGASSQFFYVREFIDQSSGTRRYIAVTCRLAGGGARVPLALTDVQLRFLTTGAETDNTAPIDAPVTFIEPRQSPPPVEALIRYNGSGRIIGRWEVVLPGDEPPSIEDLLPEGSLPSELRGSQRRYTQIARFDVYLPPGTQTTLEGPPAELLPTFLRGSYQLLLRVEATNDKEGNSNTLGGTAVSGGVAGFPLPPLRYFVTEGLTANQTISLLYPLPGTPTSARPTFGWASQNEPSAWRIEFADESNTLFSALLPGSAREYLVPPDFWQRAAATRRWRVVAETTEAETTAASQWQALQ